MNDAIGNSLYEMIPCKCFSEPRYFFFFLGKTEKENSKNIWAVQELFLRNCYVFRTCLSNVCEDAYRSERNVKCFRECDTMNISYFFRTHPLECNPFESKTKNAAPGTKWERIKFLVPPKMNIWRCIWDMQRDMKRTRDTGEKKLPSSIK